MGGASLSFLIYCLIAVALLRSNESLLWRQIILLVASIIMLATYANQPVALAPLVAFVLLGYVLVRTVGSAAGRWFWPALIAVIVGFAWLKQYAFFPSELFLPLSYVTVGMSYILFRVLHLLIDRRTENSSEPLTLPRYLIYVLNFATLVSGPIQRYPDFASQAFALPRPKLTCSDIVQGMDRIISGFFKTHALALLLLEKHDGALAEILQHESGRVGSGAVLFATYPLFLYCNFSGYIDIVVGVSRVAGIVLPENFNRPFSADCFIEFWSRWHITLSSWLRTYVYNPLLMVLMRRFPGPRLEMLWAVTALFLTFALIGVWHGQTTTFLFFGFLQGLGVAVNKLYQLLLIKRIGTRRYRTLASRQWYVVVGRGLTFTWFTFTLSWFWANWTEIGKVELNIGLVSFSLCWLLILVAATVLLAGWEWSRMSWVERWRRLEPRLPEILRARRYWQTVRLTLLVGATISIAILWGLPAPEIVYKAF
jgi:alginate O-acetyltransferase complex protein AlgI